MSGGKITQNDGWEGLGCYDTTTVQADHPDHPCPMSLFDVPRMLLSRPTVPAGVSFLKHAERLSFDMFSGSILAKQYGKRVSGIWFVWLAGSLLVH